MSRGPAVSGRSGLPQGAGLGARFLRGAISGAIGLVVWELCARLLVRNSLFLPTPYEVLVEAAKIAQSGELWRHIRVSLMHFAIGSITGFFGGVAIGIAMATNEKVSAYLDPWMSAIYSAPLVALTPLFIIWFGIGVVSKSIIICLLVIFPVIIGTVAGIRSTDAGLVEVAVSFGASRSDVLWKVMTPWALSFILSGARVGVGRGVVGIFVAELFGGAGAGIGFMITSAGQVFNTALLFVGVGVLACFGIVVTAILRFLERQTAPWRPQAVV